MSIRVGIVGVSGYGGGEALRLCATHPAFDVAYVAGESSAGAKLIEKFPGIGGLGDLVIEKWDPAALPPLDVLFASLPTGESRDALARVPDRTRIVDIGGDHRFVEGWTYGLADVWPEQVRGATRVANPGCYPAASLSALAPLVANRMIDPSSIVIDAKSGVSGAGRSPSPGTHFAEVNESVHAYALEGHRHKPEMTQALRRVAGGEVSLTFVPHLVPMTRGILATAYLQPRGSLSAESLAGAYHAAFDASPFVRLTPAPPPTKSVVGTNRAAVHVAVQDGTAVVTAAIDNLLKGAAGQAVQAMNVRFGFDERAGLDQVAQWP